MKNHKAEEKRNRDHTNKQEEQGTAAAPAPEGAAAAPKDRAGEYYDQLLRLQADFENYRKRVEKEKPELIKYGKAEILVKLLPLYDLLLAAHSHINGAKNGGSDEVLKGLEMIFREFSRVFEAEGLRPMEPVGKPYDPMACEILGVTDGTDENDGLVTEELQKGFWYGDKILRPARVKIAKKPAAQEPPLQAAPPDSEEGD